MDKPIEPTQLRILLLEDVPNDAELMEDALREAGLSFIAKRVDTREAFISALDEFKPDIVLADYKLPNFDGGTALKIVRQQYPTIPVVMVTGAVGDEKAIELLKQGARDYVLKDRLGRLGTEVRRVLAEEQSIRARKAAEQTLRQSEADFRALVENSPIAMLVDAGVGADEKIVMMNRKFTELFGYTLEDIPNAQHWWPLAYPDEEYREEIKAEWAQRVEKAFRNRGSIEPMEASITCKDGAIRYIRISFSSIGDKNILGFEDLTKRKQAEDELERFFNLIPDLVCIVSTDGSLLKINPMWQETLGYTTQEILAMPFLDLIHPDDRAATMKKVERQQAGQATLRFSNRYRCKDGSYRWLEWKTTPAVDGKLLFASARDITERKQADDRVAESERKFHKITESAQDGIIMMGADRRISFWNTAAEQIFGYTAAEATGQELHELIVPAEARPEFAKAFPHFMQTGEGPIIGVVREVIALRKGGEAFPAELSVSATQWGGAWHAIGIVRDITKRKQAEAGLAESEQHFRAVAESANDAVITISGNGGIVDWNPAAQRLFGRSKAEMADLSLTVLMPERFRSLHNAGLARVAADGAKHLIGKTVEAFGLRKDGSEFPLELSLAQWQTAGGLFFTAIIRDITERKAAEALLIEHELQYRTLADSGQALIWMAGTDKLCNYFNKVWLEFTGRSLAQEMGNGWAEGVHPDDLRHCLDVYGTAFDQRIKFSMDYRLRRHDGEYRWLQDDGCPRYDSKGEFVGYIGYCLDVTGRKLAEEELKRRNAFVETLLENAPIGFAVNRMDDGRFTYVSRRFAAIYGVPPGALEAVGDFFEKVYADPAFREQIRARVMADIDSGDAARMRWEDVSFTTRGGERRAISAVNIPLPEQGLMISTVWDVTDRHLAEESLRESEEIFSRFMEFSPIYVFFKGENLRTLRLSHNFEKMLGKPVAELLGKSMGELFPPEFAKNMVADDMRVLREGEAITVEEELDGRFYQTTKFPIFIEGKPRFLAGYSLDITERKQLAAQQVKEYLHIAEINMQLTEANRQLKSAQAQLLQSAKMASVGLLAAGVAHEINNPIGYVNSNLGTLEKYLADIFAVMDRFEAAEMRLGMLAEANDPLLEELRQFKEKINLDYIRKDTKALIAESHQGLERVKRIVLDLKNFSHADSEDQWMRADVHQLLDTTLNVVWNELKYKCEIVKEYGVLPKIYCLPSQLDQVFMNLLVNAAQAIGVRGTVTLRTGMEGEMVWVEVSDTGKGIPPEDFPHLFDPFFTTKPVGQGTGLGLSVSYSIVEKHHGRIEVHSEVGKGSTFRVWLPVQQPGIKEEA